MLLFRATWIIGGGHRVRDQQRRKDAVDRRGACHATEFNLSSNDDTLREGAAVLYRKRDMLEMVDRLRGAATKWRRSAAPRMRTISTVMSMLRRIRTILTSSWFVRDMPPLQFSRDRCKAEALVQTISSAA